MTDLAFGFCTPGFLLFFIKNKKIPFSLGYLLLMCRGRELNSRHKDFQSSALPLSYLGQETSVEGETRTPTGQAPQAPQACVSTNSTTSTVIILLIFIFDISMPIYSYKFISGLFIKFCLTFVCLS